MSLSTESILCFILTNGSVNAWIMMGVRGRQKVFELEKDGQELVYWWEVKSIDNTLWMALFRELHTPHEGKQTFPGPLWFRAV